MEVIQDRMSLLSSSARRSLAAGGAVLLLGGSAVGIAAAQTAPTPTPTARTGQAGNGPQAFVDALAKRLNISPATLQSAIDQARTDVGAPAGGFGRGGPGGPGGPRGPRGFGGPGGDLTAAAQAIGISADQLRQELPGKSLTQVAQAHGKDPAAVATALKNAAHTRIDQEVTDGHLTADQATTRKTQTDQRIDQQMTQTVPQRQAAAQ
jgi:transposase-like protein